MPPSGAERIAWWYTRAEPDHFLWIRSLNFGEPVEVGLQNVAAQSVVDEFAFALSIDQTSILELFHVMRERRGTDGKTASDIATSA